jgi:pilus assembly protein Flp/PilA
MQAPPPATAGNFQTVEKSQMNNLFLNIHAKVCELVYREEGQDLVEYALLITLIALGAVAGMSSVSSALATVFSNISNTLS